MIADQKLGTEMPNSPAVVPTLSVQELGRAPASAPSGIAMLTAMNVASTVSSMVAGKRCAISSRTGSAKRNDVPRSPWSVLARKCPYCT